MEKELEELIKNRNDLIHILSKNRFTNGFLTLLTELYPDTAHFIYELLQNAEDMNATHVRFILREDGIDFEHNGTKRSFNVSDIDSITNIGFNEQKKQDVNSIGKFGVGFKAVFVYTSTPIIHSGKYHFKIVDYFVPEFEGVKQISTRDSDGVEWTKFEIPFNKPQKNSSVAYRECLEGLKALDKSSILFLQNIRKIEYKVYKSGTCDVGYVERTGDEDGKEGAHTITINIKPLRSTPSSPSKWLKVHKLVEITDEKGYKKNLPIAVAYALTRDSKTNKTKISPIAGRVFIYFPAEKETSNLKFHINAPFASTVARDSVQNRSENNELMEQVAQLVGESLEEIKKLDLLEKSFFEVLPNKKDELTPFYLRVLNAVCIAFQTHAYLPTKDEKSLVTSVDALRGAALLSKQFAQDDMKLLFEIDKKWIFNPSQTYDRTYYFLESLGIEIFNFENFSRAFDNELFRVRAERVLSERTNEWLKDFYYLCSKAHKDNRSVFSSAIKYIQQMEFIRSSDNVMLKPSDVYLLPSGEKLITKGASIVDEFFVGSAHSDSRNAEIRSFFAKELGVKNFGLKVEIEKRLKRYQQNFNCDDDYFEDMLIFAKYNRKHPRNNSGWSSYDSGESIDLVNQRLFVYQVNNGEKSQLFTEYASRLYLGKSYGCDDGEELANALGKNVLWDEYAKRYEPDELRMFIEFAQKCGIEYELKIEQRKARENPLFYTKLYAYDKSTTVYEEGWDYYVPELDVLLSKKSRVISEIIWRLLVKEGNDYFSPYSLAQFKPNRSAAFKTCDSTFIHQLKQEKWVPQKDSDELLAPADASIEKLPYNFKYVSGNKLLQALLLGRNTSDVAQEFAKTSANAGKLGYVLMPQEQAKKLEMLEERQRQEQARKDAKSDLSKCNSMRDLFDTEKRTTCTDADDDDLFGFSGVVHNIDRRGRNIDKNFDESTVKSPKERKLAYVVETSSKQEKEMLYNWYYGKCQMCGTEIIGSNGKRHFEARNIIRFKDLPKTLRRTEDIAWNSLCLCPNCALKYQVCSHNTIGFYDQIMNTEVIPGDSENIRLHIELEEKIQYIGYVPAHFLTLKKAVQRIDRFLSRQEE